MMLAMETYYLMNKCVPKMFKITNVKIQITCAGGDLLLLQYLIASGSLKIQSYLPQLQALALI